MPFSLKIKCVNYCIFCSTYCLKCFRNLSWDFFFFYKQLNTIYTVLVERWAFIYLMNFFFFISAITSLNFVATTLLKIIPKYSNSFVEGKCLNKNLLIWLFHAYYCNTQCKRCKRSGIHNQDVYRFHRFRNPAHRHQLGQNRQDAPQWVVYWNCGKILLLVRKNLPLYIFYVLWVIKTMRSF